MLSSPSCLWEVVTTPTAKTSPLGTLLHRRCLLLRRIQHTTTIRQHVFDSSSLGMGKGVCYARRRVRYDDDDDEDDDSGEGYNSDITMLESFSEGNRHLALLVRASVDGEPEEVLIFKGFSSLLSSSTFYNPSKSVLPARATIASIDVVKGPFNPAMIEYLEKNLTLEEFKRRIDGKVV